MPGPDVSAPPYSTGKIIDNISGGKDKTLAEKWYTGLVKMPPKVAGSSDALIRRIDPRRLKKYLSGHDGFLGSLFHQLSNRFHDDVANQLYSLLIDPNLEAFWQEQLARFKTDDFTPKAIPGVPAFDQCIALYDEVQAKKQTGTESLVKQVGKMSPIKRRMLEVAATEQDSVYATRKCLAANLVEMHQCLDLEGKKRIYQGMIVRAHNMKERLPGLIFRAEATMLFALARIKMVRILDAEQMRLNRAVVKCLLEAEKLEKALETPEAISRIYGAQSLQLAFTQGKALAAGYDEFQSWDALIFRWAREHLFPGTTKFAEIKLFIDEQILAFKGSTRLADPVSPTASELADHSFIATANRCARELIPAAVGASLSQPSTEAKRPLSTMPS